MCALQIKAELTEMGYDEEFIIGLIGNMKAEGEFGILEGTDDTRDYYRHINACINYYEKYSYKNIKQIDLIQLYVDMVWIKNEGGCENSNLHYFGMGAIQWTDTRGEKLLELYLKEAGYDMESPEFQSIIQNCQEGDSYEKIYLTENQVRSAEMEMMIYELTLDDPEEGYKKVYGSYEEKKGDDELQNIETATLIIKKEYIVPSDAPENTYPKREAAAFRWYEVQYNNSIE